MSIRFRLTLLYSVILALILVASGISLYVAVSNITAGNTGSAPDYLTPMGKLLVRNVCMLFDRYHRDGERFSSTI